MGGSSFLFTCLSIGIILSVARNVEQMESPLVPATAGTGESESDNEEVEEEEETEEE
jgi:cell division protein FtsW